MGLRCLMGHDYGALQTEREREDRGGEAVVTVREFKECGRCGHRQIVSENKEVTSTPTEQPAEQPTDDPSSDPELAVEPDPADEYDDVAADEDDGVILDGDEDEDAVEDDERGPGAWPEAPDEEAEANPEADDESEPEPWPEVEGEDEGYDAEATAGGPAEDVEFGGGLTPEPQAEAATASAAGDAGEGSAPAGIRSVEPAGGQRTAGVDANVVCPECEHTAPAQGSSLRPGDICPECRRGYLVERGE